MSNKTPTNDFFNIPLIGLVKISNAENHHGYYNLSELVNNFPNQDNIQITMQVLDNAMSKSGIIKGDFINIRKTKKINNADIVVIKLGNKIFIRKYYLQKNFIRLETSEEHHSPLVIDPKTPGFELIGKVISITRQL